MYKNMLLGLGLLVSVVWMSACSSARVIPQDAGHAMVIGQGVTESGAYDSALEAGQEYCRKRGKQFAMVSQKSKYQGMDKTAKGVIQAVGGLTGKDEVGGGTSSTDDYKVEMRFKCK